MEIKSLSDILNILLQIVQIFLLFRGYDMGGQSQLPANTIKVVLKL